MRQKLRMWLSAGAILVIGIILYQILSGQKAPIQRRQKADDGRRIKLITVKNQDVSTILHMTGPLYAYDKVELYAEVSGVLLNTPKRFKEGVEFKIGESLLRIDDSVYRNNVLSQRSAFLNQLTLLLPDLMIDFPESGNLWAGYLKNFKLNAPLLPLPEPMNDQERYYIASRNIYNQYYTVKSMEATLEKYTLKAPFNGLVTEAGINPGTLVRVGQKLGEFTDPDLYEMEASISHRLAGRIAINQPVELTSEDLPGRFKGMIKRINQVIDRSSMTVKVYIHTRDKRLKDGMYMSASVEAKPILNAFSLSRDLMVKENRLYAVRDSVLFLEPVMVAAEMGDQLIVQGLTDGMLILGEPWPEAREGIKLPRIEDSANTVMKQNTDDGKSGQNTANRENHS